MSVAWEPDHINYERDTYPYEVTYYHTEEERATFSIKCNPPKFENGQLSCPGQED